MRNKSAVAMIGLSVALGIGAVVLAAQWLGKQASLATTSVVVAAKDIPIGMPLNPDLLQQVDWPTRAVPDGAIVDPKALEGRVAKADIQRGEPVLESRLAAPGTKGGLSSVIAEGKRAITVKVNEVVGVAGFALPGNHVDVVVNTKDESERPISKIVLEHILVLAVAQEANRDETKPKVVNAVTLEVTPAQAERLDLARAIGTLSLALRNQVDRQVGSTDGARRNDLLRTLAGRQDADPKAPVRKRAAAPAQAKSGETVSRKTRDSVEMIKGVQKSTFDL